MSNSSNLIPPDASDSVCFVVKRVASLRLNSGYIVSYDENTLNLSVNAPIPPPWMRLLSFVSDIEEALIADATAAAWETQRMVNFHKGIARLTLTPRSNATAAGGTILVQTFALADGSLCLKASLNWNGSDAQPVIAVYSTPSLDWRLESSRIASAWLEGPSQSGTISTTEISPADVPSLIAAAS